MLTFLGIKVSYETLAFLALFLASEVVGNSKLKENSHGPAHAPRGGGHWMLVVGLTDTHVVCHDPYGEMDNANGGYPKPGWGGKNISYTWKNWSKRWMVDGNGSGWYMTFRKLS
jgi:hypothetical protein